MRFLAMLAPYLINHVAKYILTALGIAFVSYVGFGFVVDKFKTQILNSINGVPAGMFQLFLISGGGEIVNIMFGCLAFVVSFKTMTKLTSIGKAK